LSLLVTIFPFMPRGFAVAGVALTDAMTATATATTAINGMIALCISPPWL
jgi:hypothetical protein